MPGEGSNLGLRHRDVTCVPSAPAIRHLTVRQAEARPQDTPKCPLRHSAAPRAAQRPRNSAQEHWPRCSQSSNTRELIFFGGAGKHYIHLDFYCWFWTSSPSVRAGRWAQEVGKRGQGTFNGAPLGLPSKDSSSINLVLLVTAHHCKRDHFLRKEKNKVTFSS